MRHLGVLLAIGASAMASATIVCDNMGPERDFAYLFLSNGWAPERAETQLQVRVEAIEDPRMIEALRVGARKRNIYVLVDRPTDLLLQVSSRKLKGLHIRWTPPAESLPQTSDGSSYSSVMSVSDESYQSWYGPRTWRKELFGKVAQLVIESGAVWWEESPRDAKRFMKAFHRAIPL